MTLDRRLAKSLTGGGVTSDIMDEVGPAPIAFAPVPGYQPPENAAGVSIELGGGWAFYSRTIRWIADADGQQIGPVTLRVYVGGQ